MQSISKYLDEYLKSMDADFAKLVRIARNNDAYAQAVRTVWTDRAASDLILAHTNAFYVRRDDRPRRGPHKDDPYIVCEICIDDALVRSEIDTHKELLQIVLHQNGLAFDELRLVPARRGMRKRHPFLPKDRGNYFT